MEHFLKFQLIQNKGGKEQQRNKKLKSLMKNKQQDGQLKPSHVNNDIKCKQTKHPQLKDSDNIKKKDSNYIFYKYIHMQKTDNKGPYYICCLTIYASIRNTF